MSPTQSAEPQPAAGSRPSARPPLRADHVGSLLRPPELKQARADFKAGKISAEELGRAEDQVSRRGESRPPPLAEPCGSLSAYTAPIVQPSGLRPKRQ